MSTKTSQASATASVHPVHPAAKHDQTVPIAAGGVLALLAIGGAAAAMTRRRHEDEEDWETESMEGATAEPEALESSPQEPVIHEEQPAIIAPETSAFAWGNREPADKVSLSTAVHGDERRAGESWIERAYRGPSPSNPSVSLRARLKRAAFFDKRERDAAAGLAEPVDTTAGLPEALVEERERELA